MSEALIQTENVPSPAPCLWSSLHTGSRLDQSPGCQHRDARSSQAAQGPSLRRIRFASSLIILLRKHQIFFSIMLRWQKIIVIFFDRRSSNAPKQQLNQTSCLLPVAQALDRAAVHLGRHPPCHEHCLSPHFSLLGFFCGQKVSAAHLLLQQALTCWTVRSILPQELQRSGVGGSWISGRFPFAVASWQAEAGSAASISLWLPATAASQHPLGLAFVLPEPHLSFSSPCTP